MFPRIIATAFLTAFVAVPAAAADCDNHCRVDTLLHSNVGIALDKPVTLAALKALAPVKSDKTAQRANPNYPGKNDTVHVLAFDGFVVRAVVTPENQVLVEWIEVFGAARKLPFGLAIGASSNAIRAALGPPDRVSTGTVKNGEKLIYSNLERTESATFIVQDGTTKAVIWDFGAGD